MSLVGKDLPEFSLSAYRDGKFTTISSREYKDKILVLVFYPRDFTFVCPTEILGFSEAAGEFAKEGAEILLASCDSQFAHRAWSRDSEAGIGANKLPMLSDVGGRLSRALGIYVEEEGMSQRAAFIADKGTVVYELVHCAAIGRSTDEILRVVKALNFTKKHGDVCPVNWKAGDKGIAPT